MAPSIIGNRPALSGAECSFIKMDNGQGLKLYDDNWLALKTHAMQKHASKHGLAPMVGSNVFKFNKLGRIRLGYYTECVDKLLYDAYPDLGHWWGGEIDGEHYGGYWPKHKYWGASCCIDGPALNLPDIAQQLADIGIKPYDLNYANVGWLPNGQFVCIDFGLCEWV